MTLTNAYATLDQLRRRIGINDTVDDAELELAINAASRRIDGYCGWRFWQDATVQTRDFYTDNPWSLSLLTPHAGEPADGISTTTGLIVKADWARDGTYSTTLTINTGFLLTPRNAATRIPVWPYTGVEIIRSTGVYFPIYHQWTGRPEVQITAKWGWPAVPDDITQACLIIALDLFKSKDAPFGVAGSNEFGTLRITSQISGMAKALLTPYRRPAIA